MRHFHLSKPSWLSRSAPAEKPAEPRAAPKGPPPLPPRSATGLPSTRPGATIGTTTPMGTFAARQPLTTGLGKLSALRDRTVTPAAQPAVLASVDLAGNLATRSVRVPPMNVSVTCSDPRLLAHYGDGRESIVLQRLQMKAFESIQEASREVQAAIRDFDDAMTRQPPASPREAAERQRTFESVCRNIASAQQANIDRAVQQEWGMQKQRDTALLASNVRFGVKLTMQTVSVAANATTTALLPNPLSPAKAAYSLFRMGQTIQQFAKDREQAARSIEKGDAALVKLQAGDAADGGGAHGWRTRTRELVSAVHVPFTQKLFRSVHHQEQKLDEFLAKSARVDKETRAMYAQAHELMATLADLPEPPPGRPDPHADMRREVGGLLDSLGDLMQSIERDNAFYRHHQDRCRAFHAKQPAGLAQQADAVDWGVGAAGGAFRRQPREDRRPPRRLTAPGTAAQSRFQRSSSSVRSDDGSRTFDGPAGAGEPIASAAMPVGMSCVSVSASTRFGACASVASASAAARASATNPSYSDRTRWKVASASRRICPAMPAAGCDASFAACLPARSRSRLERPIASASATPARRVAIPRFAGGVAPASAAGSLARRCIAPCSALSASLRPTCWSTPAAASWTAGSRRVCRAMSATVWRARVRFGLWLMVVPLRQVEVLALWGRVRARRAARPKPAMPERSAFADARRGGGMWPAPRGRLRRCGGRFGCKALPLVAGSNSHGTGPHRRRARKEDFMLTQEMLDTIERDAAATPARVLRMHATTIRADLARAHAPALRAAAEALLLKLDHLERCDRVATAGPLAYLSPSLLVLPPLAAAA